MSAGAWIAGIVIGAGAVALATSGPKKSKSSGAPPATGCGPTEVNAWAVARGLRLSLVSTRADIAIVLPQSRGGAVPDAEWGPGPESTVVVQDGCQAYRWEPSGITVTDGDWVPDPDRTSDLRSFVAGARPSGGSPVPIPRPPEGQAPPPGLRPPPAETSFR